MPALVGRISGQSCCQAAVRSTSLATPAVRVKYAPNANLSIQAGLFNGDPAGVPTLVENIDLQIRNPSGTDFRVNDPPPAIAEIAYAYNIEPDAAGLPGTVTLGGWHHFGRFASPRLDMVDGRLLADLDCERHRPALPGR